MSNGNCVLCGGDMSPRSYAGSYHCDDCREYYVYTNHFLGNDIIADRILITFDRSVWYVERQHGASRLYRMPWENIFHSFPDEHVYETDSVLSAQEAKTLALRHYNLSAYEG